MRRGLWTSRSRHEDGLRLAPRSAERPERVRRHAQERARLRAERRAKGRVPRRLRHVLSAHLRWYLHLFGREVFHGLIHSGGGMVTPAAVEHFLLTSSGAHLDGPPPGHPERLDPWRPLSARERALWDQLSN